MAPGPCNQGCPHAAHPFPWGSSHTVHQQTEAPPHGQEDVSQAKLQQEVMVYNICSKLQPRGLLGYQVAWRTGWYPLFPSLSPSHYRLYLTLQHYNGVKLWHYGFCIRICCHHSRMWKFLNQMNCPYNNVRNSAFCKALQQNTRLEIQDKDF